MKKAEIIYDAITGVKEELIEEALDHRFRKKIPWQRYTALAACLALFISVMPLVIAIVSPKGGSDSASSTTANSSAAAPQSPESVKDNSYGAPGAAEPGAAPSGAPSASGSAAGSTSDGAQSSTPAESAPEPSNDEEKQVFTAEVLEVLSDRLVVRPINGIAFTDPLEVYLPKSKEPPELQPGDRVVITFDGVVLTSEPARVSASVIEVLPN